MITGADKTVEKQQKRIVGKPFLKGVSGNPNGRPAGVKNFTTKVKEALERIAEGKNCTYEGEFVAAILKKAITDGDASTQKLIWNYLDGMPAQKIDVDGRFSAANIRIDPKKLKKINEILDED